MPFTCRRPKASKEPWERDTSEAAEPAALAANLPKRRRSELNPADRTWAKADGRQPGAGQMVAAIAHKERVCRLGQSRDAPHCSRRSRSHRGRCGELPARKGSGRRWAKAGLPRGERLFPGQNGKEIFSESECRLDWASMKAGGLRTRPAMLLGLFCWDAKADTSVEGHGLNLNVETPSVRVLPCAPDAGPDEVAVLPVTHMIGDVARCF